MSYFLHMKVATSHVFDHRKSLSMLLSFSGIEVMAEPGRYFAAGCMNLVTSIIGVRMENRSYSDLCLVGEGKDLSTTVSGNAEIFYYINDGIYGSLSNIIYEKAVYQVTYVHKHSQNDPECDEKEYDSAVFGPTCDSHDCLSPSVNLPLLKIGDYLWFYNVGAYSTSISTNFNGFNTKKYFYIWKD